jgi:TRAP-type mannitol/chloroaromatic compound transport system substrate-binding protein
VNVPEVYTALERGTVDGLGWPSIGVMDLSWDKFLKYRIDPGYFQTDLSMLVNLDRWNALGEEARQILQDTAIEWEEESYELLQAQRAEEGMKCRLVQESWVPLPDAVYDRVGNILMSRVLGADKETTSKSPAIDTSRFVIAWSRCTVTRRTASAPSSRTQRGHRSPAGRSRPGPRQQ